MFGYELIFTVCSVLHGAKCHDLPAIPLRPEVGIVGCMMASQIEGAKWAVDHPNHYIHRAKCAPFNRYAKA
jgi:hypothetical protein